MDLALKKRNYRSVLPIKTCVSFLEKLLKNYSSFSFTLFWCCLLYLGVSDVAADVMSVSVKEGDSVTLPTDVKTHQQESIKWYFNDTRIAQMNGDLSKTCTDVQCNEGTERFRDRLKLDHQNGSLTIMNTRNTDSGDYHLLINRKNSKSGKTFSVTVHGFFSDGKNGVSVFLMEGDSVTLHTDVKTNQQESIKWYFSGTRIAQMNGEQSKICTDVQCNEGTERFRDRLKLDNQTGSLTIMNTRTTDSGEFELQINSKSSSVPESFFFAIHDVSALKLDEMKEGGNVTLYTDVIKNPKDLMTWYFNDILIAGDQTEICTDDQSKERFRDRLKLNNQTGSLTIRNITNTDFGVYKLQINSSRFSISRSFTFIVASPPSAAGEGTNATGIGGVIGGAVVGVVVLIAAVTGVVYYHRKRSKKPKQKGPTGQDNPREGIPESVNLLTKQRSNGSATDQTVANGSATDQTVANGSATDQTVVIEISQ